VTHRTRAAIRKPSSISYLPKPLTLDPHNSLTLDSHLTYPGLTSHLPWTHISLTLDSHPPYLGLPTFHLPWTYIQLTLDTLGYTSQSPFLHICLNLDLGPLADQGPTRLLSDPPVAYEHVTPRFPLFPRIYPLNPARLSKLTKSTG